MTRGYKYSKTDSRQANPRNACCLTTTCGDFFKYCVIISWAADTGLPRTVYPAQQLLTCATTPWILTERGSAQGCNQVSLSGGFTFPYGTFIKFSSYQKLGA
ncbi:hypothetical protein CPB83DRAFT_858644 [Crepidotus variabilis]|uniref:Uncharacterized protein n=1 Tax=Crepidotus variabilis TaxID=179855 RepID=A0A9P6JMK6_9AGAR|nr:hypothetical protein CPB83DRAFT_858644 [Crepidotus variabilis]